MKKQNKKNDYIFMDNEEDILGLYMADNDTLANLIIYLLKCSILKDYIISVDKQSLYYIDIKYDKSILTNEILETFITKYLKTIKHLENCLLVTD